MRPSSSWSSPPGWTCSTSPTWAAGRPRRNGPRCCGPTPPARWRAVTGGGSSGTTGNPWAQTRHTRLDELDPLCAFHHDLKTRLGYALVPGTGKRAFVATRRPQTPQPPARQPGPADRNRQAGRRRPISRPGPCQQPRRAIGTRATNRSERHNDATPGRQRRWQRPTTRPQTSNRGRSTPARPLRRTTTAMSAVGRRSRRGPPDTSLTSRRSTTAERRSSG